ncbi:TM2 domain-containing protein [Frigoriglobus tundricola]|uniref:TM2 domain-containing protein n=1 Tax=Frigoriglobus tundricola TaxID=2774151 RepID=A0A6M5YN80_9BACT|nr:TM2 domain-containing protein [Frigoriglobus tundricola]QJW94820.1 hypothetical protein FTUN_2344 [Frigoriglobus tundricola]
MDAPRSDISPKSRLVTLLLCYFVGVFGGHRFYAGKYAMGVLQLVTLGGLGVWVVIDLFRVLLGYFTDCDGHRIFRWMEPGSV